MKNKGNTCFFNATMQCMLSVSSFITYFKRNEFHETSQPLSSALKAFIYDYQNYNVIDPQIFMRAIRGRIKLFDGRQQDAHCFLEVFLSSLIEEQGPEPNKLRSIFKIVNEDLITCHGCNYSNTVKTEMNDKYLFIEGTAAKSLNKYLTKEDVVATDSPWKCPHCEKKNMVTIRHRIIESSDCFIIHLQRFEGIDKKNNRSIHIDEELKLCDGVYENIGAVCHVGTLHSGHYYAKARRDKQWYDFNDSVTVKTDRTFEGNAPYVLFYMKKNQ